MGALSYRLMALISWLQQLVWGKGAGENYLWWKMGIYKCWTWVPKGSRCIPLSWPSFLKCFASSIAASVGGGLCARCGQALVPGVLSPQTTAWICLVFGHGAQARRAVLLTLRCQAVSARTASSGTGCSVFPKPLKCLFSLLLLGTCKMLEANYLYKQCLTG